MRIEWGDDRTLATARETHDIPSPAITDAIPLFFCFLEEKMSLFVMKGPGSMPHPLIMQLRFARREFTRALEGLSDTDARHRFLPMNCISWNIGHMAWQEQRYWLTRLQGQIPLPHLNELVGNGMPACTPSLAEMWDAWQTITHLADPFLDTLTTEMLQVIHSLDDSLTDYTAGTLLQRVLYHYWYHTGENVAIRQMLGHPDLPEFVGNIDDEAPYHPETLV